MNEGIIVHIVFTITAPQWHIQREFYQEILYYNILMRRLTVIVVLLLIACRVFTPVTTHPTQLPVEPSKTVKPSLTATSTPTITPSPTPSPSPIPNTSTPEATLTPIITLTPLPTHGILPLFTVHYHPDGGLYVGDLVSLEVISPPDTKMDGQSLQVQVDGLPGKILESANFGSFGIGNRSQATVYWAWDTSDEEAGIHQLDFSIQPSEIHWTETVTLQPASALPYPEPQASWETAYSTCCVLYYVTGTAAERDLAGLLNQADAQASDVVAKFGINFADPITITLLPRVLGNGGFTDVEISVSYLDRNYAASEFTSVLHHEMVHVLDGRSGGDLRPTMLVEGLAVYLTGGHYKVEPLLPRAAALLELEEMKAVGETNWYIPLKNLADNFYSSQHEIGYLEAAVLIEYMINRWGWQAYYDFYRDIHSVQGGNQSEAIEQALNKHFNITFDQLEGDFLGELHNQMIPVGVREDLRLTVVFYETMRRYQLALDPSAYFRTAWLLNNRQMRQRGIVADYVRRPATPENLALETMLITAHEHLVAGKYVQADETLAGIMAVLDNLANNTSVPFPLGTAAGDYFAVVQTLLSQKYQPQRIEVDGNIAKAWVSVLSPDLVEVDLFRQGQNWMINKTRGEYGWPTFSPEYVGVFLGD